MSSELKSSTSSNPKNRAAIAMRIQKFEFLGGLADSIVHDFNNLISGMFGYIEIAIDESKDDQITQYLSIAMKMIDRARDLTQQLLIFTKGRPLVRETTPLFPLIQDTAQFSLNGSNVLCQYDVAKNLRSCAIDKKQICQVIANIIINAQQAMPKGGMIKISAKNISIGNKEHPLLQKGKYVKISIKDHGIGISKERLSFIFDPFFTTKPKSHGLGLATCYLIINRHGGAMEVESVVGKGSTFHLFLPASIEPVFVKAATSNPARFPTTRDVEHKGGGRIIVMDDEEAIRDTVGKMLEMLGYSVVCKNDGRGALDFYIEEIKAKRPVTALILDLVIPGGMGGKEVVEEIRKKNLKVPVFVASGYTDDPIMKAPVEYGFTASICKPFRKIELAEMLERYLNDPKIKKKKEI
jgi:CheY-like chemotaxis protein